MVDKSLIGAILLFSLAVIIIWSTRKTFLSGNLITALKTLDAELENLKR